MNLIRAAIDTAVAAAMAEHPKYFTDKGHEHARIVIVRKVMAALRGEGDKADDATAASTVAAPSSPITVDPKSREAVAYLTLRNAAGAGAPFRMGDGKISVPPEAQGDDVLAFADAGAPSAWPFISDRQQVGAWTEFFRETLPGVARRPIAVERDGVTGIHVPWPWPPTKTGKVFQPSEDVA